MTLFGLIIKHRKYLDLKKKCLPNTILAVRTDNMFYYLPKDSPQHIFLPSFMEDITSWRLKCIPLCKILCAHLKKKTKRYVLDTSTRLESNLLNTISTIIRAVKDNNYLRVSSMSHLIILLRIVL